jgi:hypothetical protein
MMNLFEQCHNITEAHKQSHCNVTIQSSQPSPPYDNHWMLWISKSFEEKKPWQGFLQFIFIFILKVNSLLYR